MKKTLLISIILIFGNGLAMANDRWVEAASFDNGIGFMSVDTQSLTTNSAWVKTTYFEPQILSKGKFFNYVIRKWHFSCAENSYLVVSNSFFSNDGTPVKTEKLSISEYETVMPDSVAEGVLNYICQRG